MPEHPHAGRVRAFAPGRVNLIGEHTDYNEGLALAFAVRAGITVTGRTLTQRRIEVDARDLAEHDSFALGPGPPPRIGGWRAFVRGAVAELRGGGVELPGARLHISGDLPRGAGLSSSAALEVALCLALLELARAPAREPLELARICSRIEHDWLGAETGLLDQLASLHGRERHATLIDFRALRIEHVPLELDGHRLVVLDSGESHAHADSGYNQRRQECAEACRRLAISSLRQAHAADAAQLPPPLDRRARHVLGENERVEAALEALKAGDVGALGALLDASHRSLREDYEVSTPAVEAAVERLHAAGALGARLIGGGFGGHVLALLEPGADLPAGAREVSPGPGAHLIGSTGAGGATDVGGD